MNNNIELKFSSKPFVLILHWWEWKPESNWFMNTKKSLESMWYEVEVPQLPNADIPNIEEQLCFLEQFKEKLSDKSIIIWHSLGWQLASIFVSKLNKKIKSLIIVAPTYKRFTDKIFWNNELKLWERALKVYSSNNISFENLLKNSQNQILHISKDDPYINFEEVKNYYKDIKGIKIYENKKHFIAPKFDEILKNII